MLPVYNHVIINLNLFMYCIYNYICIVNCLNSEDHAGNKFSDFRVLSSFKTNFYVYSYLIYLSYVYTIQYNTYNTINLFPFLKRPTKSKIT